MRLYESTVQWQQLYFEYANFSNNAKTYNEHGKCTYFPAVVVVWNQCIVVSNNGDKHLYYCIARQNLHCIRVYGFIVVRRCGKFNVRFQCFVHGTQYKHSATVITKYLTNATAYIR